MTDTVEKSETDNKAQNDLVWGALAVGKEIGRTPPQVYHMLNAGMLEGAVSKLGHKTIVGSRRQLQRLPFLKSKSSA